MSSTLQPAEKDPNATPISPIHGPDPFLLPSYIFGWIIVTRSPNIIPLYLLFFLFFDAIASTILYLCTSAQPRFVSRHHHRCHILFDRGRSSPTLLDIFANKYILPIFTSAGKKKFHSSRSRKKLDLGGCKDFNKTLRDRFAILEENLSISRNRDTINNEIIISLVFFLRISGYFDKYSTSQIVINVKTQDDQFLNHLLTNYERKRQSVQVSALRIRRFANF